MADIVVVTDENANETQGDSAPNNDNLALTVGALIGRVENLERRLEELDSDVEEVEAETEIAQNTAETAINVALDATDTATEIAAETEAIAEMVVETLTDDDPGDDADDIGGAIEEVFLEPLVIETTTQDATPEPSNKSWLDKSWKEWRNK